MSSKHKGIVAQIEGLVLEIERLDQLIAVHAKANHSIEVKQFESLKLGFVKDKDRLVDGLNISRPK